MRKLGVVLIAMFAVVGCTDAERAKLSAYGNAATIEVYSGGQIVKTYRSSGKVLSENGSDGYYFNDAATGQGIEVSADVVITYDK